MNERTYVELRRTPRGLRSSGLLAGAVLVLALVFAAAALAAAGDLTQKPGTAGCISEDGTGGACADGVALQNPYSVAVSPDGKSAYAALEVSSAVAVFDRNPATGDLTQKPGTAGCISETGTGGACVDGIALNGARSVTVSPDGKSVYAGSFFGNAVAIFDRNTATGDLTQKPGTAGCISEDGTGGACTDGTALNGAQSVTVSPDGKNVHAAGGNAVAIFDRNTATGALTQKPGTAGCISEDGTGGACTDGTALNDAQSVTVSPDGESVYAASKGSSAVAIFDRDPTTGALTQKPGTAGCISETGSSGACTDGVAIASPLSVAVSPDGKTAYSAGEGAAGGVAVFDRNTTTGALTQKAGTAGCISEDGTGGACADGVALGGLQSIAVSPDGKSAYAVSFDSNAVANLDRDPTTGALTQKPGTAGCISEDGTGGACTDGVALDGPQSVTASPDGKNVYVGSYYSSAVAVFDRNDGNGPTTTIDSGPEGPTNDPSPSFTFSANEANSTFECKLDAESYAACTSPKSYQDLADGSHTFNVRATDTEANTGDPATREFTVDTAVKGKSTAKKTQKQKGKKVVVKVEVKAKEDLDVAASGKVTVKKKSYKLKKASKSVAKGKSATLKLMPKKSKDAKKIAKSLKKSKGKAKVDVTLADDAGNSKKSKLAVTLKG